MKNKIEMISVSLPAKLVKRIDHLRRDSTNANGKDNNTIEKYIVFILVDLLAAWDEADGKCNRFYKKDIAKVIRKCGAETFVSPDCWDAI